jgi:hypothetical protein
MHGIVWAGVAPEVLDQVAEEQRVDVLRAVAAFIDSVVRATVPDALHKDWEQRCLDGSKVLQSFAIYTGPLNAHANDWRIIRFSPKNMGLLCLVRCHFE